MLKKNKSAIILCGGKGSRLGNLGKKIPKALAKVQKKEILWYIISILIKNNFNHLKIGIFNLISTISNFRNVTANVQWRLIAILILINYKTF